MQAYAIFDGGGVKGAALAGCLKAAQDSRIEFIGYGGTSAGSIVALLAAVGYTGDELESVMTERLSLSNLADELEGPLSALPEILEKLSDPGIFLGPKLARYKKLLRDLSTNLGFAVGKKLIEDLHQLVVAKHKHIEKGFTFHDLARLGCRPLKIVASDLRGRKPLIFSNAGGEEQGGSVLDAVRASMSYPFAFQPVKINDHYLVDGGLCTNLPVFLFDREREGDRLPLLAFDLVAEQMVTSGEYGLKQYCLDMLETSLEAGDFLMRRSSQDVHHIQIRIPAEISPLDFRLTKERLKALFLKGIADTYEYIQKELGVWQQATNPIEVLQARHASPEDVRFVLEQFASHLERATRLTAVRTHVMLPTDWERRIVAYQYNMDNDADQDLSLAPNGGCSGKCWTDKLPAYADLVDAGTGNNHVKWNMTWQEQKKVRPDRKTMLSIPIFAPGSEDHLIGVLSADSDAHLPLEEDLVEIENAIEIGKKWAVVLTAVLG
jgi:NTE family protein